MIISILLGILFSVIAGVIANFLYDCLIKWLNSRKK